MKKGKLIISLIILSFLGLHSGWIEHQKVVASDCAYHDYFGKSVSICGDFAFVGSRLDDDNGSGSGSVYIYFFNGTNWIEQSKITPSDAASSDAFGTPISLSLNYALIGALGDDDNGSAYIFNKNEVVWLEQAKINASDGESDDRFGESVAISDDFAVVGARYDDDNGYRSGSAYIYRREGSVWTEAIKITASDGSNEDYFGSSVSIYGDYIAVGAWGDDDNGQGSGAAYIFHNNSSTWYELEKLTATDGSSYDVFGTSTSIFEDYILVGAPGDDDNGLSSGSVYVYHRNGANWIEQEKLIASDGEINDSFGYTLELSDDYAIIGTHYDDVNGYQSGSAYIFKRDGNSWNEQEKLIPSDGATDDEFGEFVSISNGYALIGAEENDDFYENTGSAYFFKNDDPPLPIQLSSFTAILTQTNFVNLKWITQSESNLLGYNVYRNLSDNMEFANCLTNSHIPAFNTTTEQNYSFIDEEVETEQTYYYWLESVEMDGTSEYFGSLSVTITSEQESELPEFTELKYAYPNPFNPAKQSCSTIQFSVKENEIGDLLIYNTKGQTVRTFPQFEAGNHSIEWDGKDNQNKSVGSGLYLYQLQSESFSQIRKMVIIR